MKRFIALFVVILSGAAFLSCNRDWLEPKPLSFYSPENTYINADGLYAAVTACERNLRHEYTGDAAQICTEMFTSDICVIGQTDAVSLANFDLYLLPSNIANSADKGRCKKFWSEGYAGIKYANIVLNRLDCATFKDEAERNAVMSQGYFHRAIRYFHLVHQFGDVPWIGKEVEEPKIDFYTYDRWSILEELEKEMEFAYQWIPEEEPRGRANKWAAGALLMKIYMANMKWDKALEVGQAIIDANPLMTKRFTSTANSDKSNLMLDLHSVEAKIDATNTEGLMYVVCVPNVAEDSERSQVMRNSIPYWAKTSAIKTPDGKNGVQIKADAADQGTEIDNDFNVGRGIATARPSNYYQYEIWTEKEANDLRSPNNPLSWRHMEDLYYNHPTLKKNKSKYYGTHLVRPASLSVGDSIRCWFSWPHYKLFVPDPTVTSDRKGGETPWYVFRTAEIYLMMAECYYWKGDNAGILRYINPVRERAQAEPLTGTLGISDILAERARELYYEEYRHCELVRMSYTYAKTGKPCEAFGGHVYKMENFSGPEGVTNCKDHGYNFFFDWVDTHNGIYNRGVKFTYGEYVMSVHHVLWPIPETSIESNTGGVINQNAGYPGIRENITPLKVGQEKPGDEI